MPDSEQVTIMPKIEITDVILRDAHQSLIATRMRTEDMLPICDKLDRVGYWSLECWGGATYDACIRFLKEDPWERLRKLRAALPNTRTQMLLRGQNLLGYRHYADDVVRAFVLKAAENGVDVFRIFDALNDTRNMRTAIEATVEAGKHAQGAISYTVSPVHDIEGFVAMARELADMGCHSIAIKDMAGLLTPYVTADLVKAIKAEVDLPLQIHSHSTSGLAAMCHLKAIENGAERVDTAISSWSGGTSHPPTESLVAGLRGTEYDTGLDLELLQEIGMYFYEVRKKYHQFESEFTGVDTRVQVNQIPGGMISNLANQLKEQNALDRMQEVMEEIPRVRKDLGYPPLVTPTSQIVGTQAVLNVLTGERYQTITNEVKLYLQGGYGRAPGPVNEELRRKAVGDQEIIDAGTAAGQRPPGGGAHRVQHRAPWRDLPHQDHRCRSQGAARASLLPDRGRRAGRGHRRDPGRSGAHRRRRGRGGQGHRRAPTASHRRGPCHHLHAGQHRRGAGEGGRRDRGRPAGAHHRGDEDGD